MSATPNVMALTVFVLLFGIVALMGFLAAALARGQRLGAGRMECPGAAVRHRHVLFLLGGDLYKAYNFIVVPALVFGQGVIGFYAVPYTIFVYPMLLTVFRRLWSVARRDGYVLAAISCAAVSAVRCWLWRWRSLALS